MRLRFEYTTETGGSRVCRSVTTKAPDSVWLARRVPSTNCVTRLPLTNWLQPNAKQCLKLDAWLSRCGYSLTGGRLLDGRA